MVYLQRVTRGNPFADYPVLRTIFSGSRIRHVEADTLADLTAVEDPFHNHIYIVFSDTDEPVGITGFFAPDGNINSETLTLRWHGIIPGSRKKGYSKAAFNLVCIQARNLFPYACWLHEILPLEDAREANGLLAYFKKLGFELDGKPSDAAAFLLGASLPANSGEWQLMRFCLKKIRSVEAV